MVQQCSTRFPLNAWPTLSGFAILDCTYLHFEDISYMLLQSLCVCVSAMSAPGWSTKALSTWFLTLQSKGTDHSLHGTKFQSACVGVCEGNSPATLWLQPALWISASIQYCWVSALDFEKLRNHIQNSRQHSLEFGPLTYLSHKYKAKSMWANTPAGSILYMSAIFTRSTGFSTTAISVLWVAGMLPAWQVRCELELLERQ